MPIDKSKSGEAIKRARQASGLSQEELANLLEVSRQSVSNWERGEHIPEIEYLLEMRIIFQVSLEELLGLE